MACRGSLVRVPSGQPKLLVEHRVHGPDRHHNDAAADAFFARRRSGENIACQRQETGPETAEHHAGKTAPAKAAKAAGWEVHIEYVSENRDW